MSDAANVYVSYATGTKGGGFISNDSLLLYNILNSGATFDFDSERARAWEVGAKLRLLDRRLDFDVALFRTDFKDLQVSSYNGVALITGNAATARAQGVEVETRFRPNDIISLGGSGAYLDATYRDYPGGPCVYNAPSSCRPQTNNLAGLPLTRAPKWKYSLWAQLDIPVGTWVMTARGSANHTSLSYFQGDMDPLNAQPAYTLYDARLALRNADRNWELALIGRNLTNKVVITQAFNTPVLGNNSHLAMVGPPRMIALEGTLRF